MRNLILSTVAAGLLLHGAAEAQPRPGSMWGTSPHFSGRGDPYGMGQGHVQARIWVDDEREYFRRGERLRVRFSTSDDAYAAVVHIDPDGNLDFLYPFSPWDDQYVRGGRVYTLPRGGLDSGFMIRGRPGIGYLYLVVSPVPLDFHYFRGGRNSPWDWGYAGRMVQGDPFWAFQQMTRLLLPDWGYTPYGADFFSYHVDGIHRYPSYACSNTHLSGGWGWNQGFGACDRMDLFLRDNPYYFDSRRYRGDRSAHFRRYDSFDPRHEYREAPRRSGAAPRTGFYRDGDESASEPATRAPAAREPVRRAPAGRAPASGQPAAAPSRRRTPGGDSPAQRREPSAERASEPARRPAAGRVRPTLERRPAARDTTAAYRD